MPHELGHFITHLSSKHTKLDVRYAQGVPPTLELYREDESRVIENIATWTAAEVDAHLQKVL
jgi:hypothetical protein